MLGFLEGKILKWDGDDKVEHMWEQVKQAKVESARVVCGSVRVGGNNLKSICWNKEIKVAVRGKEVAWKGVLVASDETKRCMEANREKKKEVKRCI